MRVNDTANFSVEAKEEEATPDFALVFYNSSRLGVAVTRHDFVKGEMQMGEIMDQDKIFALLSATKQKATNNKEEAVKAAGGEAVTLMPQNVLFEDADTLVWYQPARMNPMWYRLSGAPFCLHVEWPALMFMVNKIKDSLKIFTLDSNERPTLDSQTYWTPLANIYERHSLCQGSAPLPKERSIATLGEMESTFYDSAFDGFKHTRIFKGAETRKDGVAFWKEKEATGKGVNAKEELYPFATVREIIENRNNKSFFSNATAA